LISKGADLNAKNSEGWTALHHAAKRGHKELILILIDASADLNAQTNTGKIPADYSNSKVRYLFDPDGKHLFYIFYSIYSQEVEKRKDSERIRKEEESKRKILEDERKIKEDQEKK
jgi:ankyrin repeat protein